MPDIETSFMNETYIEQRFEQEKVTAEDESCALITLEEFRKLFRARHPKLLQHYVDRRKIEAKIDKYIDKFWNKLFGHNAQSYNPRVVGMTRQAAELIIEFADLDISGLDFQHHALGFALIKNPNGGGIRNVLHYNRYLAEHDKLTSPLAITYSHKELSKPTPHPFTNADGNYKKLWYEFFVEQMQATSSITGKPVAYCTEEELRKAFIHFCKLMSQWKLTFPSTLPNIDEDFNPIVLLGRFETVLMQPHLKPADRPLQWAEILNLDLQESNGLIRLITDNIHSDTPCGFIMESFKTALSDIHNTNLMYYLAFKKKRHTLQFYQDALKVFDKCEFTPEERQNLTRRLIDSTTDENMCAWSQRDEETALQEWTKVCTLLDKAEELTTTIKGVIKIKGKRFLKTELINHFTRLSVTPNLFFLSSIANHIEAYLKSINPATSVFEFLYNTLTQNTTDPLAPLIDLSDKLCTVIRIHGTHFYSGCKFYFQNGRWVKMDIASYTELQHALSKQSEYAYFIPVLSTFSITKLEDLPLDITLQGLNLSQINLLRFSLNVFEDIQKPQSPTCLPLLLQQVKHVSYWGDPEMAMLAYLEANFSNAFPPNYFEMKKAWYLAAKDGLPQSAQKRINQAFVKEHAPAIITIEGEIFKRHRPNITEQDLEKFDALFLSLSHFLEPEEFTIFLERLVAMKESLAKNYTSFYQLLKTLVQEKSLEGFNQIFLRQEFEKSKTTNLPACYQFFIEKIKPMIAKTRLFMPRIQLEEMIASVTLHAYTETDVESLRLRIRCIITTLNIISEVHPQLKTYLLQTFHHIPRTTPENFLDKVEALQKSLSNLGKVLQASNTEAGRVHQQVFYAILAHFHDKPERLIAIERAIACLKLYDKQATLWKLVSNLINNKRSLEGLEELLGLLTQDKHYQTFEKYGTNPPYPKLQDLSAWLRDDNFDEKYQIFAISPFGPRDLHFAFDRRQYYKQKALFVGVDKNLFSPALGDRLEKLLRNNRRRAIASLQTEIQELRACRTVEDKEKLLCLCIEMLARTTSQSYAYVQISQELNTTQVMALYAMIFNSKPKIAAQIDTGEGKSRINMVLSAFQAMQGKTVDFQTSNMPLAERDYFAYSAFFSALNIRTGLITLNTPKQLYQQRGVNFTDDRQLILLRNQSDIELKPNSYRDPDRANRCLVSDEFDKLKCTKSKDTFNFATPSTELQAFVWIYPHLVDFIDEDKARLKAPPASLVESFVNYVMTHELSDKNKGLLGCLYDEDSKQDPPQIPIWIQSAITAWQMPLDGQYKVSDRSTLFPVRDSEGHTRYTRKAYVLDGGRVAEGSTYSEGIHQCLCAIENKKLHQKDAFIIQPENSAQRVSYPAAFFNEYSDGLTFGTSGSIRGEAWSQYPETNYENYAHIIVPREHKSALKSHPIKAVNGRARHLEVLKQAIALQLKCGKPVLLICKDDIESNLLYTALTEDPVLRRLITSHQRIHGLTTAEDEQAATKKAGGTGVLTVTNKEISERGIDIDAEDLQVFSTFLPTLAEEIQIKGRTARGWKAGAYRCFIDLSDPDTPVNGNTYSIDKAAFEMQRKMAMKANFQEEVSNLYALFLEEMHQRFFRDLDKCPAHQQESFLKTWKGFLNKIQKDWTNNHRAQLLQAISLENSSSFKGIFGQFTEKWNAKRPKLEQDGIDFSSKTNAIYQSLLAHKSFFRQPYKKNVVKQDWYDFSDDGQARVYKTLFAQTRATIAGERPWFANTRAYFRGEGVLFADLRAVIKGERLLFANLLATIERFLDYIRRPTPTP